MSQKIQQEQDKIFTQDPWKVQTRFCPQKNRSSSYEIMFCNLKMWSRDFQIIYKLSAFLF